MPMLVFGDKQGLLAAAELTYPTMHGAEKCLASRKYLAPVLHQRLSGVTHKADVSVWAQTLELPLDKANIDHQHFKAASRDEIRGTGCVVDSFEAAPWSFWQTDSYLDAGYLGR